MNWLQKAFISWILGNVLFCLTIYLVYSFVNQRLKVIKKEDNHEPARLLSNVDPTFKMGLLDELKDVKVQGRESMYVTNQYYYHSTELGGLDINEDGSIDNSVLLRSQLKKKQRFLVVLKHGNLFLYKDDSEDKLLHAISLKDCFVTLWPRQALEPATKQMTNLADGALFTKRTCIAIFKKDVINWNKDIGALDVNLNVNNSVTNDSNDNSSDKSGENDSQYQLKINGSNQFFIYFDNNYVKEDWYFKLINTCKSDLTDSSLLNPSVSASTAHLNTHDTLLMIQDLNSTKDQYVTKWFNALIGRLFLSLQQTDTLNKFILDKVYKKLTKINKPGFLGDFIIQKLDVGNSIPYLTNPKVLDFTPEGLTKIKLDLQYKGNLSIIVSTKLNINLGSRFKPRVVPIQLSMKVKEISGPLILVIKPPPSNRIWYAFESEPTLDLDVEPIVSSSRLSYNLITNAIKSKFAEGIKESLVLPYMDDIVFFHTDSDIYRGGIWERTDSSYIKKNVDSKEDTFTVNEESTKSNFLNPPSEDKKASRSSIASSIDFSRSISSKKSNVNLDVSSFNNDGDDDDSVDSANVKGKKYFKNSLKKINKWYKENVVNNDEDPIEYGKQDKERDEDTNIEQMDSSNKLKTSATELNPTMISNRRKIQPPHLPTRLNTIAVDSDLKQIKTQFSSRKSSLTQVSVNSPEMEAAEMFAKETTQLGTKYTANDSFKSISSPRVQNQNQFTNENNV